MTMEIKFPNCHRITWWGLCLTLRLHSSDPYFYSVVKFTSLHVFILVTSFSFSWMSVDKLNRQILQNQETCSRLCVSELETSEEPSELKFLVPRQLFHSFSLTESMTKIKANISPVLSPPTKNKWRILGNSALFLLLSSSLNAWLSPQAAQARTVSLQNYANMIIILADKRNMICLRINCCILSPEIWNTFQQITLLASILFVHLNFVSFLRLISGRIGSFQFPILPFSTAR